MSSSWEKIKKYIGKEVIYDDDKKAHIYKITSYDICIQTAENRWWSYKTGNGTNDNAVARGDIRFVDESLKEQFVQEYEEYIHSESGQIEAYAYYSQIYD